MYNVHSGAGGDPEEGTESRPGLPSSALRYCAEGKDKDDDIRRVRDQG